MWVCPLSFSFWHVVYHQVDIFPNIVQVIFSCWLLGSKYGWQWRTLHTTGKKLICAGLWFVVRNLFCKSFWTDSRDFQAETKMCSLLGKVGRIFVRVKKSGKTQAILGQKLEMCRFLGKLGRDLVRKSNMQISGQTRVVCGKKIKCAGFWANPCYFRSEIRK